MNGPASEYSSLNLHRILVSPEAAELAYYWTGWVILYYYFDLGVSRDDRREDGSRDIIDTATHFRINSVHIASCDY
jgi:hypothetical protein